MSIPVMLHIEDRNVLVVGGGRIGTRKAISLWNAGARVTCISREYSEELLAHKEHMNLVVKEIEEQDIAEWFLVIAATNHPDVNQNIYEMCTKKKILCQTVDRSSQSDLDFMAKRTYGELVIAASTYGEAPGFAKEMVDQFASTLTEEDLERVRDYIQRREKSFYQES